MRPSESSLSFFASVIFRPLKGWLAFFRSPGKTWVKAAVPSQGRLALKFPRSTRWKTARLLPFSLKLNSRWRKKGRAARSASFPFSLMSKARWELLITSPERRTVILERSRSFVFQKGSSRNLSFSGVSSGFFARNSLLRAQTIWTTAVPSLP